jgi:hypothetical protein
MISHDPTPAPVAPTVAVEFVVLVPHLKLLNLAHQLFVLLKCLLGLLLLLLNLKPVLLVIISYDIFQLLGNFYFFLIF